MNIKPAKLIATADGNFPFQFMIEKAIPSEEDGQLIVEGVASTTNVDHDQERMSENALKQMAHIINEESVPLRVEHQKDEEAVIGKVYQARVDDRNQLWIKAVLDKVNPLASLLHKSLKEGAKLGLSVGGRVKRATRELVESVGKVINTFYDIVIDEVSVTKRPANYDAWLFAKSYDKLGSNKLAELHNQLFNQFLFEYPQLDYLGVFEKSIPNHAWRMVAEEIKTMRKQTNPVETASDVVPTMKVADMPDASEATVMAKDEVAPTETKPTEAVKQAPADETKPTEGTAMKAVRSLEKMVADGFEKMFTIVRGIQKQYAEATGGQETPLAGTETPADFGKDDVVPTETKPGEANKQVPPAPSEESERTDTAKQLEAIDQVETKPLTLKAILKQLDGVKPEEETVKEGEEEVKPPITVKQLIKQLMTLKPETEITAKEGTEVMPEEEAAKEGDELVPDETTKEDTKTPYGNEYMMPQLKSVLKKLNWMSKSYQPSIRKSSSTIDEFVFTLSQAVDSIVKRMEHDGKRVLGIEQQLVDVIRNDSNLQKSIKEALKEPGAKKSVALGIPYMITKEGKRYSLIAQEAGVQKSVKDDNRSFKDVYKSDYSSESVGM